MCEGFLQTFLWEARALEGGGWMLLFVGVPSYSLSFLESWLLHLKRLQWDILVQIRTALSSRCALDMPMRLISVM